MSQKWKWLILGSLFLNVLLIGLFLGRVSYELMSPKPGFPPPHLGMQPPGKQGHFMHQVFLKSAEKSRVLDEQIQSLRDKAHLLLTASRLDKPLYDQLMVQLTERFSQKFMIMNESIFQLASELTPEQRKAFVEELSHPPMRPQGPPMGMPPPPRHHHP